MYRTLENTKLPSECFSGGPNTSVFTWDPFFAYDSKSRLYLASTKIFPEKVSDGQITVRMIDFGVGFVTEECIDSEHCSFDRFGIADGTSFGYFRVDSEK